MTTKPGKSNSNINRHTSKSSIVSLRKERSSHGTRERRSSAQSIEEDFAALFQKYCRQFQTWITPKVVVIPQEPPTGNFPELLYEYPQNYIKNKEYKVVSKNIQSFPQVLIIFDNYEIQTVLNTVILKHFLVDRSMLIALRKSFQKFDTVGTLKLEFCGLTNTDLRTLKTILQKNEVITDLSINGNPNRFQNFYILLKNTKLKHASMRFCQINDRGVHHIALQLNSFSEQSLLSLNLSSNFISDNGIVSIASFLRSNRKLISLNLADNWITNIGCATLMNVFIKFALTHEEIVIRRHRIMKFLFKKANLMEIQKSKLLEGLDTQSLLSYNKRLSKDSANKGGRDSTSRKSSKVNIQKSTEIDMQLVEEMVEAEIGSDEHPFVKDSYPEDNEIYCKGNVKLVHLNLAYNKITVSGLEQIIGMLQYQKVVINHSQEGFSHIILEGNLFPESCSEIDTINELLKESFARRFSSTSHESRRNSKRKKSGLSRVSITI
ncbi:hypothetical protein ILUMI_20784 [Ignelater luminosus]|uniref:Uncharacterized protein n=1 Tax=Ignelater luminosus TaxID=2038154 RepID=A0A8K0CHT2_IGNLU|nr:hypothetical protein ILUMI_20784 [Ignelater luminosus]